MSIPLLIIPPQGKNCEPFIKQGTTIPEIPFDMSPEFDGDLRSNHIVRLQLYKDGKKVLDISSVQDGGITITGEKTFKINKIIENDFPIGDLMGDLIIEEYVDLNEEPINITPYCNVKYVINELYSKRP